jgi:hypothetical protein
VIAIGREPIQESIGGGIIRLTRVAGPSAGGRKKRQEIQADIFRGLIQMDDPGHLGGQHGRGLFGGFFQQEAVRHHAGAVQDAVEPAVLGENAAHDASDLVAVLQVQFAIGNPGGIRPTLG